MTVNSLPVCSKFWGYSMNKLGKASCSNRTYTLWGKTDKPGEQVTYGMLVITAMERGKVRKGHRAAREALTGEESLISSRK